MLGLKVGGIKHDHGNSKEAPKGAKGLIICWQLHCTEIHCAPGVWASFKEVGRIYGLENRSIVIIVGGRI